MPDRSFAFSILVREAISKRLHGLQSFRRHFFSVYVGWVEQSETHRQHRA